MSPPRDTADEPEAQPEAPQPKAKAKAKAKKPKLDPAPGSAEEWRAIARKAKNAKAISAAFKKGDVEGVMYLLATFGGSYVKRPGDQPPQVINAARAGHIKALAKIAGRRRPR